MDWDWLIDTLLKVGGALAGVFGMMGGGLAWAARRTLVSQDDFEAWQAGHVKAHAALDRRLAEGETEFAVIRADLDHLPKRTEIEELIDAALKPLAVSIEGVKASIDGTQDLVRELLSHELAEARAAKAGKREG